MKKITLIKQLIALKKKKGFYWNYISSRTGISVFTLSRIINGHHKPIAVHREIIEKFINRNS